MAEITFINQTNGKWAGKGGHTVVVTVSEGFLSSTKREMNLGDTWVYQPKSNEIKITIKSKYVHGWPSLTHKHKGARLNLGVKFYIVESDHATSFDMRTQRGSLGV